MMHATAFMTCGTSTISDALDALGIPGQVAGIRPVRPGLRVVGPAFTVRYVPVGPAGGTVGDFIDGVAPGAVVAIDNGGRADCTVWGDILTSVAARRGIAGTVIHGVCRDVAASLRDEYAVFSCGVWMRTGKDRVTVAAVGDTISLGTVSVEPGDTVVGDDDGVVVVPKAKVDEVARLAVTIGAAEDQIRRAVAAGDRLTDARKVQGYHELQRRRSQPEDEEGKA